MIVTMHSMSRITKFSHTKLYISVLKWYLNMFLSEIKHRFRTLKTCWDCLDCIIFISCHTNGEIINDVDPSNLDKTTTPISWPRLNWTVLWHYGLHNKTTTIFHTIFASSLEFHLCSYLKGPLFRVCVDAWITQTTVALAFSWLSNRW